MEIIYTGKSGQKLFLYNSDNFIYLRSATGAEISRAILLCNDYADGLSSVIYNDSIHFVYQNLHGNLILRSIMDSNILYQLSSQESPDYKNPKLITYSNHLLLLYFITNPLDNTYQMRLCFPLEKKDIPVAIPAFTILPIIHSFLCNNGLFLFCKSDEEHYYEIDENNILNPVHIISNSLLDEFDAKEIQHHLLLQKEQEQNNILKRKIAEQDAIIESIKQQYEDLMNTALQYREEAAKWHNKYYSKNKQ